MVGTVLFFVGLGFLIGLVLVFVSTPPKAEIDKSALVLTALTLLAAAVAHYFGF